MFAAVPNFCFESTKEPFLQHSLSLSSSEELDELLLVPDVFSDRKSEPAGLLDLDDLFSPTAECSSTEAATVLQLGLAESEASTSLSAFDSPEEQLDSAISGVSKALPLRPASPPTLPPSGLSLKLDLGAVASAWGQLGGGRPAIGLSSAELVSVAASIPSLADRAASLSPETALAAVMADSSSQGSHADWAGLSEEEAAARRAAAAARAAASRDKKAARAGPSKKVRYEMRRINAEKRPRIKGRFVKKSELEQYLAQQRAAETCAMVPAC